MQHPSAPSTRRWLATTALMLCCACSNPASVGVKEQKPTAGSPLHKPIEPTVETKPTGVNMENVIVSNKQQMTQFDGQTVVAKGKYVTQDLGRHKITTVMADGSKLQSNIAVSLALSDGAYLFVGARPEQERKDLDEKQVEIRGLMVVTPKKVGPDASGNVPQQMDPVPTLMNVASVQLASS